MQRFEIITSLPSRLSCIILQDWLNLKSGTRLSSAFCCHSHRSTLVALLESDEFIIHEQVFISSTRGALYLLVRFGEKLRSVVIVCDSIALGQEDLMIANCHHLKHVMFAYADSCTPELWALLRTNPHIESLKVNKDFGAAPFLNSFSNISLPKLSTLVLRQYIIDDENIVEMLQTASIAKLDLSECAVAESVLVQIVHHCPRLEVLSLQGTTGVNDEVLDKITLSCPHILHLDISYVNDVTDAGILSVVQNLKRLESLNIVGVYHQTDVCIVHIYTHCTNTLHTVVLNRVGSNASHCHTDCVNNLLERCTQLRNCYLYDHGQGSRALIFTPGAVCYLTKLVMRGAVVSEQNLSTIGKYGVHLQTLIIDDAYEYTCESLSYLVNGCPKLSELYYVLLHDYSVPVPEHLTPAYWMEVRPQLCIVMATKDGTNVGAAPDFMNVENCSKLVFFYFTNVLLLGSAGC